MTVTVSLFGADIGFDLPEATVDKVVDELGHVAAITTDRSPAMLYRQVDERGERYFVRDDPARTPAAIRVGDTVGQIVDDLHLSIALHAVDGVFIHAGAVAWNGTVIVLPGRSLAGKSTLVEALVRAGATYLSDEYAVACCDGQIAPYARAIQLRTDTARKIVEPRRIGIVAHHAMPIGLILLTRYRAGARFAPEPVRPAEASLAVFDNTVVAERNPEVALATAAQLARAAVTMRTDRPEAADVTAGVLELAELAKESIAER